MVRNTFARVGARRLLAYNGTCFLKNAHSRKFLITGFVVLTGTDTMAYAASAMTFMFQNLVRTNYVGDSSSPQNGGNIRLLIQSTCQQSLPFMVFCLMVTLSDCRVSLWCLQVHRFLSGELRADGFKTKVSTPDETNTNTMLTLCLSLFIREPYNDARKNLIMAIIFASSDTISEVSIFFHDRLIRGCRATKINTSKLLAFDR